MVESTEDTVRAVLVGAITEIVGNLGFEDANGNVKEYLFEEEIVERHSEYLMARVGGEQEVRAWAVQVYGREDYTIAASAETGKRFYTIVVDGYYGAHNGTPINLALTHARKVREAIVGQRLHLANTVDRIAGISQPDLVRFKPESIPVDVYRVRMTIEAERRDPQW